MSQGTTQDQRLPPALRFGHVLPDELSLAQRVRSTLEYAARVAFVDEQGQSRGSWGEALERDESVIMADIAAFPIESQEAAFMAKLPWAPLPELMGYLEKLVVMVDGWYKLLRAHASSGSLALAQSLAAEIQGRLGKPWRECRQAYGHMLGLDDTRAPAQQLHPLWGIPPAAGVVGISAFDPGQGSPDRERLRKSFLGFAQALRDLRGLALERLPASLRTRTHEPSMGLLLAFLQLQQQTLEPLNRFPERLTDFYYHNVLRMRPRPAAVDQVHLLLEIEPRYEGEVRIPDRMQFIGGRNTAGKPIAFAVDNELLLANVRVAALCSLQLERDSLISPEGELGFVTRAKAHQIPLVGPAAANLPRPEWWPLFGGQTRSTEFTTGDARLGFAISTPLFELKEGEREIKVGLTLRHPADQDAALRGLLNDPPAKQDLAWLENVFARYEAMDEIYHPTRLSQLKRGPGQAVDANTLAQEALARSGQVVLAGDQYLRYLLARCLATKEKEPLAERLGILFAAWLVASGEDLLTPDLAALRAHARPILADGRTPSAKVDVDHPLALVYNDGPLERSLIFDRVFWGTWGTKLSINTGWLELPDVFTVCRASVQPLPGQGGGIELTMRIGAEHPPICACVPEVHGAQWPPQAMVQFELRSQTRVFAYSLLQQLEWREMDLSVSVKGLREVVIYNQLGRLDPTKPLQPFGPLPAVGSYFLLSSPELASKPLQSLQLNLSWGGLPMAEGGFPEHYSGYPGAWENEGFQVEFSILRDGQWRAVQGPAMSLFSTVPGRHRVAPSSVLRADPKDLRGYHRAQPRRNDGLPFQYDLQQRNGFFRFELRHPDAALGHALYSRLITEVLTRNARLKQQKSLPREPYTPIIERLTVDYEAELPLNLSPEAGRAMTPETSRHRIFQLLPFGSVEIYPGRPGVRRFVIPRIRHDGSLFIGVEGVELQGPLSLFFHLRKEAALENWTPTRPGTHWERWCRDGWRPLAAEQVLSDTTLGFLRSGIVCLDLPADMSPDCPILPSGLYWLRLSADWGFEFFAGLYGVYTNAISATRVDSPGSGEITEPVPPGTITAPLNSLAGLRSVLQLGPSFGLRGAETRDQLRTRSGERLRHKGRASTEWDIERLLLDAFPEIYKVKCFPHYSLPQASLQGGLAAQQKARLPGHVLVVVVPTPQGDAYFDTAPLLDAVTLARMTEYLRGVTSPAARIVLRNATYERVQVRCAVRLSRGSHPGSSLRTLNEAIVQFLSPWHGEGYEPVFDWEVRAEDLEAHLRTLDCVAEVGQISMLHIVRDDTDRYWLGDSARQGGAVAGGEASRLKPAFPWSLVLPTQHHLIELVDDLDPARPRDTGVARLEVGRSFIVSRGTRDH